MSKQAKNHRSITANQCRKIHALKGALALTDEEYRGLLQGRFKVDSSTDLNFQAAGLLIEEMEGMAVVAGTWTPKAGPRQRFNELAGRGGGMATPAQLRKIEVIWLEVSRAEDPVARTKGLRGFIERTAKVSDMRFLDQGGATKVINGLEAMQRSAEEKGKSAAHEKTV